MDFVRPWIVKTVQDGPLEHLKLDDQTTGASVDSSVLPLQPFRAGRAQFIRFLSPHRWGIHEPIWAQVSDRHVKVLVYLSSEIVKAFESDQRADQRSFGQLGYPTFFLGGCRWVWDSPPYKQGCSDQGIKPLMEERQLCLKVVNDLPNKSFRFASTATFPFPNFNPDSNDNKSRQLHLLGDVLKGDPRWNLLVKRLQVTMDPRLSVSGLTMNNPSNNPQILESRVLTAIPYTGPSKRIRAIEAHRKLQRSLSPYDPLSPFSRFTKAARSCPATLFPLRRANSSSHHRQSIRSNTCQSMVEDRKKRQTSSHLGLPLRSVQGQKDDRSADPVHEPLESVESIPNLLDFEAGGEKNSDAQISLDAGQLNLTTSLEISSEKGEDRLVDSNSDARVSGPISFRQGPEHQLPLPPASGSCPERNADWLKKALEGIESSSQLPRTRPADVPGVKKPTENVDDLPSHPSTHVDRDQRNNVFLYVPVKEAQGDPTDRHSDPVSPASKPFILKIKGRNLSKYFDQKPIAYP